MTKIGKLYSKIMAKLNFEPGLDAYNITISLKDGGIVILGGEVKSYAEKRIAEEVLQKIKGVNGIVDELRVNLATDYIRRDMDILNSAMNVLEWNFFVPDNKIKVMVQNGNLTLLGNVEQYYQKIYAQKAIQNLLGVISITNNITVKPIVDALDVKEKIIQEFERNARIDANNIEVNVNGSTVTLKGIVGSFDEDQEARVAAWSVPGVSNVIDQLLISW
jgi:osmotically-inducible protein OsmY